MGKVALLAVLLVGTTQIGWTNDPVDKKATSGEIREVRLVDGTTLNVSKIKEVGRQLIFTLENGSMVAFQREDIELSTVTEGLGVDQSSFVKSSRLSTGNSDSRGSESLGARGLHDDQSDASPKGIVIQITGDGSVSPSEDGGGYEKIRQRALADLELLAEQHSETAAELTTKMDLYIAGCYATSTTYHETKTTGVGLTTGKVDTEYEGAWAGANTNGVGTLGVYQGSSSSTFVGQSMWSQESQTTSTSYNSDTPYCLGLFSEIKRGYSSIGPAFTDAIQQARLSYVLDSETDAILTKHGIGTTGTWMKR